MRILLRFSKSTLESHHSLLDLSKERDCTYILLCLKMLQCSFSVPMEKSPAPSLLCKPNVAESRYPTMEKMAFALVTTSRRLRPYF